MERDRTTRREEGFLPCSILNSTGRLVGSELSWLEGMRDLWSVSVGAAGWDWGFGQGRKTSRQKENLCLELNLSWQKQKWWNKRESGDRGGEGWNINSKSAAHPLRYRGWFSLSLSPFLFYANSFPLRELTLSVVPVIYNLAGLSSAVTYFTASLSAVRPAVILSSSVDLISDRLFPQVLCGVRSN